MYCQNCGNDVESGRFCQVCGSPLEDPNQFTDQAPRQEQSNVRFDDEEESYSGRGEKKPRKSNTGVIIAIVAICVVAVIAVVVVLWQFGLLTPASSGQTSQTENTAMAEETPVVTAQAETVTPAAEEESTAEVSVPDTVGMSLEDALDAIGDQGLTYKIEYRESADKEPGFVISQTPAAGSTAKENDTVKLYVAKESENAATAATTATPAPTATATPEATAAPANNTVTLYCCASDYATLRASASRSAADLAHISSRESMTYLSTVGEFYQVTYNGQTGYVLADFVSFDPNAPLNYGSGSSSSGNTSVTTTLYCCASEFATLRSGPSRESTDLGKIYSREAVEYKGQTGEFYYVSKDGQLGYVLKAYFSTDPNAALNYGDN